MLLKATILLGTLKTKSRKEFSNTAVLCELLCDEFAKHEVKTEIIRLVEYEILPGTKSDMGKKDEWPRILEKLARADIIVFATPYGQKIETAGNTGGARFPRLLAAGRPLRCLRYGVTIERWREWPGKSRTNILTIRGPAHRVLTDRTAEQGD